MGVHMKRLLFGFMIVLCFAWGQSVPHGLGLDRGTRILVFVAPNCVSCEALGKIEGFPITFVGRTQTAPYHPYLQDQNDLLARSLRIQKAPTLVVLKDGWEVKRLVGQINLTPKAINLLLDATEAGLIAPQHSFPLTLGEPAPEPFQNFTGLLVFGFESCSWCAKEKDIWTKLCQQGVSLRVIYSEGKWPEACVGELNPQLFGTFDIPGTPTHVYLHQGRVIWIGVGYRSDLEVLVKALIAMGVKQ